MDSVQSSSLNKGSINQVSLLKRLEPFICLAIIGSIFGYLGSVMGLTNMINTMMNTAHQLLLNTVFFIMGITVMAGALSRILIEYGVVNMLEKVLYPLMRPLFNLPGKAALAGLMTFFSDNPAIISLAHDKRFSRSFKPVELISLANFGTVFGMGLIVVTYMATKDFGTGGSNFGPAMVGVMGAVGGGIISTRLMQLLTRDMLPDSNSAELEGGAAESATEQDDDGANARFLNAILDGGKSGVELGMAIIPGVLIISTFVMMLTFGPGEAGYTGGAFEGVKLLPALAEHISGLFYLLFGFEHGELIAFPMTSLGAVGAALSMMPVFAEQGFITGSEIAVLTAMGMCWSGFLSTHTAMLDTLGQRRLISKAILAHTVAGICAGVIARYLYLLIY
ncbi:CD0519/CD1768 family membrane protein [Endozoicomonadaceae bacterium StTr2]